MIDTYAIDCISHANNKLTEVFVMEDDDISYYHKLQALSVGIRIYDGIADNDSIADINPFLKELYQRQREKSRMIDFDRLPDVIALQKHIVKLTKKKSHDKAVGIVRDLQNACVACEKDFAKKGQSIPTVLTEIKGILDSDKDSASVRLKKVKEKYNSDEVKNFFKSQKSAPVKTMMRKFAYHFTRIVSLGKLNLFLTPTELFKRKLNQKINHANKKIFPKLK